MKTKKCKVCKNTFQPARPLQTCCSPSCAMQLVKAVKVKKDKQETKLKLDALQTKPQLVKKAQAAFNRTSEPEIQASHAYLVTSL